MSTKVDQDGIMFAGKRDERLPPPPCGCPVTRTLMWPPAANFDTIHHRAGCNGLPMCIDVVPNGNGSTSECGANRLRQAQEWTHATVAVEPVVTAKQFVRAFAGHDHFEPGLMAGFVQQVDRYTGCRTLWLFEVAHDSRQMIEVGWRKCKFVMMAANGAGGLTSQRRLVVGRRREADGECVNLPAADFGKQSRQRGRVHSAAQERANRHVAQSPRIHCFAQTEDKLLGGSLRIDRRVLTIGATTMSAPTSSARSTC